MKMGVVILTTLHVNEDADWQALVDRIGMVTGRTDWEIMFSFPPKSILTKDPSLKLRQIGIRNGELLILKEPKQSIRVETPPESMDLSELIVKEIPDDNSCLFNAIGYLLEDHKLTESQRLRDLVADMVMQDPYYDHVVLGKPKEQYCQWITKSDTWGGAIELSILSKFYQVQIVSIDVQTLRMDVFGEAEGYTERVYVIYSGIHYDALTSMPFPNAPEPTWLTVFSVYDDATTMKALSLAELLRKGHQFTDMHRFTITCDLCKTNFIGQKEAQMHAKATGHTKFSEYMGMES